MNHPTFNTKEFKDMMMEISYIHDKYIDFPGSSYRKLPTQEDPVFEIHLLDNPRGRALFNIVDKHKPPMVVYKMEDACE